MVARVGGRGRGLVQALLRVRKERAGRVPQNLQRTLDVRMRPQIQEVGPCGQEVERRLGRLQIWERQNGIIDSAPETVDADDGQQTVPKFQERPRTRVRQGQDQVPPPTPRLPYNIYSPPVGHFMAPCRCPYCEDIPKDIFPLPSYSVDDPGPPPHYEKKKEN